MSPTDSNPFASTSGSFNISTGTGTVNNDISSNPDNGPITVPKSASKISSTDDLIAAILTLLEYLIGVLAVIGLIIGGIQYITASGDQAKAEKAKKTLLYSIIGITIAVLSLVLTDAIACALTSGQLSLTCSGSGSYNWDLKTLLQTSSSTCPAAANSTTLGLCNIEAIVEKIAQWALDFAGVAAFIMIMYSSVVYLTSYGEESKAETAKKTLMWSVIGMAVVVFSKVLVLGIIGYFK
jgi:hypothetical protein